ncbi:MAG: dihydrodipicolinate synthase family protein [Anaerolineales bacterium]|nr:dihydrodipicolinate synthase family protein [Anaerolineales bacterium]
MTINNTVFKGIICPMLTPFDAEGQIDFAATRKLVDFLVSQGVNALLPAGTTGEGMLLTTSERMQLAEAVVDQAAGRVAVLVHTGAASTAETVALTLHAQQIGAHGASIITPYFYSYDDDELFAHYAAIARAAPDFPLSLYVYPGNAKQDISVELFKRLRSAAPNYVAIKLSSLDLIHFQEYALAGGPGFSPLCGVDGLALAALSVGAVGQVSGNANVFPKPFCSLYAAYASGDRAAAQEQQRIIQRIRGLFKDSLAYFKAALAWRGMPLGKPRPPIRDLHPAERDNLYAGLEQLISEKPEIM